MVIQIAFLIHHKIWSSTERSSSLECSLLKSFEAIDKLIELLTELQLTFVIETETEDS